MRILIICPRLCHGGAERVAVSLADGFVGRGHEVVFFADLFEERTYVLNPAVKLVNLVSVARPKTRKWLSAIRILRKYVKQERPDVVIGIMSLCSMIARMATIGTKIPVIATEHDSFERPDSAPMSRFLKLYKFYICKVFTCVTVLTDADKKVIGNRVKNVVVMPNPLVMPPTDGIFSKKNIILAAGRVDNWHYKGFDVLIKAWGEVVKSEKRIVNSEGWRLQIAGVWRDEKTREYLDGIAEEYGVLDKIDYLGFVNDMQPLYEQASIFVLSSRYEGFGLVLIEAMSQGCACIACDYKGRQREIVLDDTQGLTCEPDDVEALAEVIEKMIIDTDYRKQVQRNAIARSEYYSMENTMDRWEALLKQVVKK